MATTKKATTVTAPTGGPTAVLGLVLDVGGKSVTINASNIADIKANGFDMGITSPVVVGTFQDIVKWIDATFSVSIPTDGTALPAPLGGATSKDGIVNKCLHLQVTILKAHLHVAGTESKDKKTYYTFVMSMLEDQGDLMSFTFPGTSFKLGIKGAVLGVTNEAPTTS